MVDRYTKAVLTVIAGALVFLVAQNATRPVGAQDAARPMRVVVCDPVNAQVCANVRGLGGAAYLLTAEPVR